MVNNMENKIKWMPKEICEMQIKLAELKGQGFFGKGLEDKIKEIYNIDYSTPLEVEDAKHFFN